MEAVALRGRNVYFQGDIFEPGKTLKDLRSGHFLVSCGKNLAGNVALFKGFQSVKKNLEPSVSDECDAYFKARAAFKIFNKLIEKTSDRPVCNKMGFFHSLQFLDAPQPALALKNGRYYGQAFLRFTKTAGCNIIEELCVLLAKV